MDQPKRADLAADEFIAWALEQPNGRFELHNGTVVAMTPEPVSHGRAKARVWRALDAAIAARGLACEALPDGATVRIDAHTVYEPDALVRCGPPLPGDTIEVADPIIVVGVLSPSSRGIDTSAKLVSYFSLAGVRHYLIVDTGKRLLVHYCLVEEGRIESRFLHDGTLALNPPGLTLEVPIIFSHP